MKGKGFNFVLISMTKSILLLALVFSFGISSCQTPVNTSTTQSNPNNKAKAAMETSYNKTEEEWKKILTPEQYHVLREKGTERPHSSDLNGLFDEGTYVCGGCGTELFKSTQKFDGHCGWPSFDGEIGGGDRVKKIKDLSFGMVRTEIVCAKCGGHLGHIFDDGPTKSGLRYCVNGLSIGFKKLEKDSTQKK